jgi:hypothetical protein
MFNSPVGTSRSAWLWRARQDPPARVVPDLGAEGGEAMTSGDVTPNAPISPTAAADVGVALARWWDALLHQDASARLPGKECCAMLCS